MQKNPTKTIACRVLASEHRRFMAQAKREGFISPVTGRVNLSAWITNTLKEASK